MPTPGTLFAAQFAISSSTLAFCMTMLWSGRDPGVYLPIITGVLGYWLPSPSGGLARPPIVSGSGSGSGGGSGSGRTLEHGPSVSNGDRDNDLERPFLK
jgi:hypothetical protein